MPKFEPSKSSPIALEKSALPHQDPVVRTAFRAPGAHHEGVVHRYARDRVDASGLDLFGLLDEAGQVLRRAQRREGPGNREEHHALAGEDLPRGDVLHAFGSHRLEGDVGDLLADLDRHGRTPSFRAAFAGARVSLWGRPALGRAARPAYARYPARAKKMEASMRAAWAWSVAFLLLSLPAFAADEKAGGSEAEPVTTESGLIITELTPGTGDHPQSTSFVEVHYHGTFADGKVFDSSVQRGQPARFPLNRVIACWTEGVQRMRVGGKSRLVCPPQIAYGKRGSPPKIPPDATLTFEVELLGIVR
jgi:FKBP-type peptidyl-prolyl cis-trans isomerase